MVYRNTFVASLVLLAAACGGGDPPANTDGGGGVDAPEWGELLEIRVEPQNRTVYVDNAQPTGVQYRAYGTYADGETREITNDVVWTTFDPSLLVIDTDGSARASTLLAGQTIVRASRNDLSGETPVTIIQRSITIGVGVDEAAP